MAGLNNRNHMRLQVVQFLVTVTLVLFIPFFITDSKSAESSQDSGVAQKSEIKGNIYNLYNTILGSVDIEGNVTNRYGRPLGSVNDKGVILNVSRIVIGQVTPEGNVSNQSGTIIGSVSSDGAIYNVSGRKVGEVRDAEDIIL
ncbi:MAG TPA: hypothetical protein VJ373_07710, partial [Desulfatiglandales bacterium]|nr:hypothetical protein [Desulfatiglandales bacterium]